MTNIPLELANARKATTTAWDNYDKAIEDQNTTKAERNEMLNVVGWMEERQAAIYAAWQRKGGTSDIEVLHPVIEAQSIEQAVDAWLESHIIRLPHQYGKVTDIPVDERVSVAFGQSELKPMVDVTKKFGATAFATPEWVKRHLND
jgi:hypothetical protein